MSEEADKNVDVADKQAIEGNTQESQEDSDQDKAAAEYNKSADGRPTMQARVYSPFKSYFDGVAFSLSAENKTGPFDILPRHHNFISLLVPCIITIRTEENEEKPVKIKISGGIIHVKADEVIVFLDV
jgi:hypothetical protein